jgi:pimeloyl-ACP methyl ester carboxylesterase
MPIPRVSAWRLPDGVKSEPVNGYDLAYVEHGAGVPVIFVHGSGLDYRYFAPQMEPFGEHYRAIAVSLRHCYPEPWRGDGEFSLDEHALDLTAFIRQVAAEPAHLVGMSRGGTVSLYAARLAPELIRSLTFAEGGNGMHAFAPEEPALRDRSDRVMQAVAARLAGGDVDGALAPYLEFVNGPDSWEKLPRSVKGWFRDNAWTLAAASRYTLSPFSCADAWALDLPVLLVGADSSPPQFRAILDRLQPCLRRGERALITHSSHGMSSINPVEFNATVMAFIARY